MRTILSFILIILASSCSTTRSISNISDRFIVAFGDEGVEIDKLCKNKEDGFYLMISRSNNCYTCVSVSLYGKHCAKDGSVEADLLSKTNIFYETGSGKFIPVFHQEMLNLIKRGITEGVTHSICVHSYYSFEYNSLKMKRVSN